MRARVFYETRELLKLVRDSYNASVETTELDVLRPVLEAELLVLDDLGAEKKSEWVDETIGLLVNTRYSERRVTVFTTNLADVGQHRAHVVRATSWGCARGRGSRRCATGCRSTVRTCARGRPPCHVRRDCGSGSAARQGRPKNTGPIHGLPPKAGGQARASLKERARDGKGELKWPGGRAGSE